MTHALEHVAAFAGMIVPIGLGLYVLLGRSPDDVIGDPDAAQSALKAERARDAQVRPFNGRYPE